MNKSHIHQWPHQRLTGGNVEDAPDSLRCRKAGGSRSAGAPRMVAFRSPVLAKYPEIATPRIHAVYP
jgi:hypothetical protein